MNKIQKILFVFLLVLCLTGMSSSFNNSYAKKPKIKNTSEMQTGGTTKTAGVEAAGAVGSNADILSIENLLGTKTEKENMLKALEEEVQNIKQAKESRKLTRKEKEQLKTSENDLKELKQDIAKLEERIAFLKEREQNEKQLQEEPLTSDEENPESGFEEEDDDGMNMVSPEAEMEEEEKDFILYDVTPSFNPALKQGDLLAWGIPVPSIPTPRINKKSSSSKPADVPNQAEVSDATYNCLKSMEETSNRVTDAQVDQFLQGLNTAN